MAVNLEPFIADLKGQLTATWPEILPSAGGGGVIDSEHLTTIAWATVKLPLGVILIDQLPKADGPLDKLWYRIPAQLFYVCAAPGSAKALRTKLVALVNRLWLPEHLTTGQVVDIEDPSWADSLLINQVLRSANRAQRGGRIIAHCLVPETEP